MSTGVCVEPQIWIQIHLLNARSPTSSLQQDSFLSSLFSNLHLPLSTHLVPFLTPSTLPHPNFSQQLLHPFNNQHRLQYGIQAPSQGPSPRPQQSRQNHRWNDRWITEKATIHATLLPAWTTRPKSLRRRYVCDFANACELMIANNFKNGQSHTLRFRQTIFPMTLNRSLMKGTKSKRKRMMKRRSREWVPHSWLSTHTSKR